uniref:Uncharacterized protein n=1 Tax=Onchocerca volvulus TaxID=6282 RepID=A0A8R1XZL0_ONCVO
MICHRSIVIVSPFGAFNFNKSSSSGQLNERLSQCSVHDQVEETTCEYRQLTAIQFKCLSSRYQYLSFTHRCLIGSELTLSYGE